MILNISSYLKNSLYSLLILSLSFACTNQNIISNKIDNKENIATQNKNNEYNFYFDGDNTKPEKNNVRIKLSLGTSFNTKAQVRKRVSDITNIQVFLCDLAGNPLAAGYTLLFNNKLDLNDLTLNIRNLPIGTYYAKAIARDSGFNLIAGDGDDNILNQNVAGYDISSNSITVNSPALNLSIIQDLKINLALKDAMRDTTEFLFATTNQVIKPQLALDEKGNGIAYWKSDTKSITFAKFKNFVPIGLEGFYFSGEPNLTSIGDMTAYYSNGKGCLAFVKNKAGTTEIFNKKFTLNDNGYNDLGDFFVESTLGAGIYKDLNMQLDSKGTGTLVFSKLTGGKYNIYTMKYTSYTNSGSSQAFFEDSLSDKTLPRVAINNNGNGAIIWEDNAAGNKEIVYSKLSNYTSYANGTISASGTPSVTGTTTSFTKNFPNLATKFIRIQGYSPNILQVQNITNDLSMSLTTSETFAGFKYASFISTKDAIPESAPNMKCNISGDCIVAWKNQNSTIFSIKGLKLSGFSQNTDNGFNPNSNNILNGPVHSPITDIDASSLGLSMNPEGNGFIIYSVGNTLTSRGLAKTSFTNYNLNTSSFTFSSGNDLVSPDVALNNNGSGIVIYPYNPSIINLYGRHIFEYSP